MILKLTQVFRDGFGNFISITPPPPCPSGISTYDTRSPKCLSETWLDMIILVLANLLCLMPDLSAGSGMQLALLTINQLHREGEEWWWWDGQVLAVAQCSPSLPTTWRKTAGSALSCSPSLLLTEWPVLSKSQ